MSLEKKLIEEVRKFELIYNVKHEDYKKLHVKDAAWEEISKKIGKEAKICKIKWKSLRDSFRKYKRRMTLPSRPGSSDQGLKKWKYYNLLKFLDDFECCRIGVQSVDGEQIVESQHSSDFLEVTISPRDESLKFFGSDNLPSLMSPSSASGSNSGKNKKNDLVTYWEGGSEAIAKLPSDDLPNPLSPSSASGSNSGKKRKTDISNFWEGASESIAKLSSDDLPSITSPSSANGSNSGKKKKTELSNLWEGEPEPIAKLPSDDLPNLMSPSSASGSNSGKNKKSDLSNFWEGASDALAKLSSDEFSSVTTPMKTELINRSEEASDAIAKLPSDDLPSLMNASSTTGSKSGKKKADLSTFLEEASNAIAKLSSCSPSNKTSPLVTHFIYLAERIESSNIPKKSKLLIEQDVSHWVLKRIIEETHE